MNALVLIPTFNEKATLAAVMRELRRYYQGHVVVVDDGSTDGSVEELVTLHAAQLHVIRHERNLGYGAALISGFEFAKSQNFEVVVTMDCDFQHEPCQVPQFLNTISARGIDILSGSRYLADSEADDPAPPDRMRINRLVTERINALTGYALTDSFCGFKAYRVEALRKLVLTENGYSFPLQLWLGARHNHLTVEEIAVARIYKNKNRTFGSVLDDPGARLDYYLRTIDEEAGKWDLI